MRLSHLFSVAATALLLPGAVIAEESIDSTHSPGHEVLQDDAGDASVGGIDLASDRSDHPESVPGSGDSMTPDAGAQLDPIAFDSEPVVSMAAMAESEPSPTTAPGIVLGPVGVDDQGRTGRLHTVATGDTLWDLSAAYLGTPWVWPSVWIDNDDIANPHLILPDDKIWITANEMRVVSNAEAESFLEPLAVETSVAVDHQLPADVGLFSEVLDETAAGEDLLAAFAGSEDDPSTLDAFPVAIFGAESPAMGGNRRVIVAGREQMGFVTAETLAGASSIVASPSERTYLSSGDRVYVGMGEGDVEVGDQFTIFRVMEEVRDVETNRLLGHHVQNLGWIEIQELTGDTSIGQIRQANSEILRGTRLAPREKLSRHVTLRATPDAIEGQIVFLPSDRAMIADGGYVYINRGEFHGVEVGSELEVFDGGVIVNEQERRVDVRTPDANVATLVVVSVEADSSVAFVLKSSRELTVGDSVRPIVSRLAGR